MQSRARLFIVLLFCGLLGCESREPPSQGCTLDSAQTPILHGLALGMSPLEVQARFPLSKPIQKENLAILTRYQETERQYVAPGIWIDDLLFIDGALVHFQLHYAPMPKFNDVEDFAEHVQRSLNLPAKWPFKLTRETDFVLSDVRLLRKIKKQNDLLSDTLYPGVLREEFYDESYYPTAYLECDGFRVTVGLYKRGKRRAFLSLGDPVKLDTVLDSIHKRAVEENLRNEKQKETFKP